MATAPLPPHRIDAPDVDRGINYLVLGWTLCGTAMITQMARLYSRGRLRQLGWDDYLMFLTMVLYIGFTIVLTFFAVAGGGRHVYYVFLSKPASLPYIGMLLWAQQPFLIIAQGIGKASVGVLILRFLAPQQRWQRWTIWACIVTVNLVLVVGAIFIWVQCDPPEKLWNKSVDGHCIDPKHQASYAMASGAVSAVTHIILVAVPITVFRTLNIDRRNKIALSFLFGIGLLAGVAAFYKMSRLPMISRGGDDFTWNSYDAIIWSALESWFIILGGTAPTLKPLFDQIKNYFKPSIEGLRMHGSAIARNIRARRQRHGYNEIMPEARGKAPIRRLPSLGNRAANRSLPYMTDNHLEMYQNQPFPDINQGIRVERTIEVEILGGKYSDILYSNTTRGSRPAALDSRISAPSGLDSMISAPSGLDSSTRGSGRMVFDSPSRSNGSLPNDSRVHTSRSEALKSGNGGSPPSSGMR